MHDFCFTIPYGLLVLAGGALGYLRRGSTASLAGGAAAGIPLLFAGFFSLKAFEKRRNSYIAMILETGTVFRPFTVKRSCRSTSDFTFHMCSLAEANFLSCFVLNGLFFSVYLMNLVIAMRSLALFINFPSFMGTFWI
ncbi:hypothetical protein KSP39_PZI021443 [Platanthera zijinensis]|uniref:Uncharacterized protein n=1 Tax=Platanthera zijinensis TaxID=2320716 RepID=A0AAP0AYW4_9ASPA